MIHSKILIAALVGTFAYTAVSFIAGQNGVWCYRQLEEQKMDISRQTAAIQAITDELSLECTALLKDRDVIAAYARRLDYVGNDEKLVKISGLRPAQTTLYDTGTVLRRKPCYFISEPVCKACGLVFFCLALAIMTLFDLSRTGVPVRRRKKESGEVIGGIPVYDVSQV